MLTLSLHFTLFLTLLLYKLFTWFINYIAISINILTSKNSTWKILFIFLCPEQTFKIEYFNIGYWEIDYNSIMFFTEEPAWLTINSAIEQIQSDLNSAPPSLISFRTWN